MARLQDLVARTSQDLRDPRAVRYSAESILRYMKDATRELAALGVTWRTAVLPGVADQARYTLPRPGTVEAVTWDGSPLVEAVESDAMSTYGPQWRTRTGTPRLYIPQAAAVLLVPVPTAGTPIAEPSLEDPTPEPLTVATNAVAVAERVFNGVEALGLRAYVREETGERFLFEPGDGTLTDYETARRLVEIRHTYTPVDPVAETEMPGDWETALRAFARWRALQVSRDPEDMSRAAEALAEWTSEAYSLEAATLDRFGRLTASREALG